MKRLLLVALMSLAFIGADCDEQVEAEKPEAKATLEVMATSKCYPYVTVYKYREEHNGMSTIRYVDVGQTAEYSVGISQ